MVGKWRGDNEERIHLITHPSGDCFPAVARLEFSIRAVPFRQRRNRLIAPRASGPCQGKPKMTSNAAVKLEGGINAAPTEAVRWLSVGARHVSPSCSSFIQAASKEPLASEPKVPPTSGGLRCSPKRKAQPLTAFHAVSPGCRSSAPAYLSSVVLITSMSSKAWFSPPMAQMKV